MTKNIEPAIEQLREQIRDRLSDIRPNIRGLAITIIDEQIQIIDASDLNQRNGSTYKEAMDPGESTAKAQ